MAPPPILLVEDDVGVADALCAVLRDEGFGVEHAINGERALDWLGHHPAPAMILLDLMMPVVDGYEFRRRQRADPALAEIPTVCITAGVMDGRIREMGLAAVLKKPLEIGPLLDVVERYAQKR